MPKVREAEPRLDKQRRAALPVTLDLAAATPTTRRALSFCLFDARSFFLFGWHKFAALNFLFETLSLPFLHLSFVTFLVEVRGTS